MYPLTMMLLLFSSLFLLMVTGEYLAEKRFAEETEKIRLKEYYTLSTLKELEKQLNEGEIGTSGMISFQQGSATYETQDGLNSMNRMILTVKLSSGEKTIGIGIYDKEKKRMVKWIENN